MKNNNIYKRLLFAIVVCGYKRDEAVEKGLSLFRETNEYNRGLTNNSFGVETIELSEQVFLVRIYDIYFIDQLSILDRFRHMVRKFLTALQPNFHKKIRLGVVKTNGSNQKSFFMNGTLHTPDHRLDFINYPFEL